MLDSLVLPWVDAQPMSLFPAEVAQRHADEFVFMVMDQAGWHLAGELVAPEDMRLMFLPPYSPELNPTEHLWEALREQCFANHVFTHSDAVERTLTEGLRALEADPERTNQDGAAQWKNRFAATSRALLLAGTGLRQQRAVWDLRFADSGPSESADQCVSAPSCVCRCLMLGAKVAGCAACGARRQHISRLVLRGYRRAAANQCQTKAQESR